MFQHKTGTFFEKFYIKLLSKWNLLNRLNHDFGKYFLGTSLVTFLHP